MTIVEALVTVGLMAWFGYHTFMFVLSIILCIIRRRGE